MQEYAQNAQMLKLVLSAHLSIMLQQTTMYFIIVTIAKLKGVITVMKFSATGANMEDIWMKMMAYAKCVLTIVMSARMSNRVFIAQKAFI